MIEKGRKNAMIPEMTMTEKVIATIRFTVLRFIFIFSSFPSVPLDQFYYFKGFIPKGYSFK